MKKAILHSWLIIALAILLSLAGCPRKNPGNVQRSLAAQGAARVTFIELGSVNCIPCIKMQDVMRDIEREYGDQVDIVFHDVWTDAGRPYGQQYQIRVIPTQIFLNRAGEEYFRHEGYFPKEELLQVLRREGVK